MRRLRAGLRLAGLRLASLRLTGLVRRRLRRSRLGLTGLGLTSLGLTGLVLTGLRLVELVLTGLVRCRILLVRLLRSRMARLLPVGVGAIRLTAGIPVAARHAGPRFELRMLTGIGWEPAGDRLSGRAVDEVAVDAFEPALRGPPRRAEDPALEFVFARLPRREEARGLPRIGQLHRLHGMRAGRHPVHVLAHLRHGHLCGIAEHGQDHAHRGAHTLLAEQLHRTAVTGHNRPHQ